MGSTKVHPIKRATLIVISTIKGIITSFSFIVTCRILLELCMTWLTRQILLNRAEKTVVNPIDSSHGIDLQAFEHPSGLAIDSSIDSGMIALDITKHPTQINPKKNGWDALATRLLRYTCVQIPQTIDADAAITKRANPTGRIPVKWL